MEQLAPAGSIRLTAATLRLVEGLVQANALGPFPVKGLVEPVEVFELIGVSALRQRLRAAAARGLTRFVGRQQELMALQQALEQARVGHGQLVAVVGEAGVGKSRLVYEFLHAYQTAAWLVEEILQALLGDDPSLTPLTSLLLARTQGNPFFLEESVRTLVETGVLVGEPGAYSLGQALPTIQVPATVQAVPVFAILPEHRFVSDDRLARAGGTALRAGRIPAAQADETRGLLSAVWLTAGGDRAPPG
jgi:hypothetical protein